MLLGLRFCFLALYAAGPVVAMTALVRRRKAGWTAQARVQGWRWYIPPVLLPIEWLLPPALLLMGVGEIQTGWISFRVLGLAIGLGGAALLMWASHYLGRFLVHEAAIFPDHTLITTGPYRLIRHPIYSGYLALLLGSGLGMLNIWLLLLWPLSFIGIRIQAGAEERLLDLRFGQAYQRYANSTGMLVPWLGGRRNR
jgi:protein-S-isoprenylcysteine O-methyltransferase Ste14